MNIVRPTSIFLLVVACTCAAANQLCWAQVERSNGSTTHGAKTYRAVPTESSVMIDGALDDPAWNEAPVAMGFVQRDPQEGQPSTENTEFRVLYTPTVLYVGVICYDSNPQRILGTDRRRDSEFENDDVISIVLDTFHDHRNSYLFKTNPLGAQYDALVSEEGNNINVNWDERWEVATQINEAGWVAEFAIPFKSLRVRETNDGMVWGLDVERIIRRKNEFSNWNNYQRGFRLEHVSQAGHLSGLSEIETGLRLRVKPYLLGGFTQAVRQNPPGSDSFRKTTQDASDIGIEVVKYRITPGLTADFTWNTDFAQTEVDSQQVNLDRFPLFFPEKREFFQEGAGIFEFAIVRGEGAGTNLRLFHSRQIGLSPRRQPVPLQAGGRLTGKVGGFTLGLINAQTEDYTPEGIPASNYSVIRVKQDVLERSAIGGFVLNREIAGTEDFNRVYGTDANFVFYQHLHVDGLLARSDAQDLKKDNWVTSVGVLWDSDFALVGASWLSIDRDFRDDLGFVPRKNMRLVAPQFTIFPRPRSRIIRQFRIGVRSDYTMDQNFDLETRVNHYPFDIRFQRGDLLSISPHSRLERLSEPFGIRSGISVPPGTYSWWYVPITYRSNPADQLSWNITWRRHFGFFGGDLDQISPGARLRITEQFALELDYELNKGTFPDHYCSTSTSSDCGFTDHVVNTRILYNFNNQWLTSTILQYNSTDDFFGINFRLNYIFRPGDDFFLIYNEGRRLGGVLDGQKDRTLQAKLTYSFDY